MEILLPSTGSRAIAGANGIAARIASSWGVKGGGASAVCTLPGGLGGGPSSVRTGGGLNGAGRGCVVSIVSISNAARAAAARGAEREHDTTVRASIRIVKRLIRFDDLCRRRSI